MSIGKVLDLMASLRTTTKKQCPSVFESHRRGRLYQTRFCLKREGHEGDHRGIRVQWGQDGQRKLITEKQP